MSHTADSPVAAGDGAPGAAVLSPGDAPVFPSHLRAAFLGPQDGGTPQSQAMAAVFIQRLFTAYLPPIWGWVILAWMRRREYV